MNDAMREDFNCLRERTAIDRDRLEMLRRGALAISSVENVQFVDVTPAHIESLEGMIARAERVIARYEALDA